MKKEKHYYLCFVWLGKKKIPNTKLNKSEQISCCGRLITGRIFPHKKCLESMGKKKALYYRVSASARIKRNGQI